MPKAQSTTGLQTKSERKRKRFKTIRDVAEHFAIPEATLIQAATKAFVEMVDKERLLVFPLKIEQSEEFR